MFIFKLNLLAGLLNFKLINALGVLVTRNKVDDMGSCWKFKFVSFNLSKK